MFIKPVEEVIERLEQRARELGKGCRRVFVSCSGGVDSSVVATVLCRAFGADNTVAMHRMIKSAPKHRADVAALQQTLGFRLIAIQADELYDAFLAVCREQFKSAGLAWHMENSAEAQNAGWDAAYASLKSRFTTPFAGFIAKAVDEGRGRIFGTGNAEEDVFLRYYDKFGDGAVDNNILNGLTKAEVRQIACHFAKMYRDDIFYRIASKTPSADLLARGDDHNDENELTGWARKMGFDITISYGTIEEEGNVAWALKQDLDHGIIMGRHAELSREQLKERFGYAEEELQLILFLRRMEQDTRHKALPLPGLPREVLRKEGFVD